MQAAQASGIEENATTIAALRKADKAMSMKAIPDEELHAGHPLSPAGIENSLLLLVGDVDDDMATAVAATLAVKTLEGRKVNVTLLSHQSLSLYD